MTTTLEVIAERITTAKRFADVFGKIHAQEVEQKKHELRKQYVYMVKNIHPDRVSKTDVALASTVFSTCVDLYERAKLSLENNSYDEPFLPNSTQRTDGESTISSSSRTYVVQNAVLAEGDFSDIHFGKTEDGNPMLVKIASDPTMNQYLENEAVVHNRMSTASVQKSILRYVPALEDSVLVDLPGNMHVRVNIFTYHEGYLSLSRIREVYPDGLDPRDAAWIWRRVLGQTITAKLLDVVHGALVPDHTLVHPVTHDPLHIGWAHSVLTYKDPHARLTTCIDRWKDWYPTEVYDHLVPTHATDLYMAGKTMIYLLGGDVVRNRFPNTVPLQVQRIVKRCVETDPSKRPQSGYEVLQQFTDAIYQLWGKTYRQLIMPS